MSHPKRPRDPNQLAKSIIDIATGQKPDRDPTPEEQGKDRLRWRWGKRVGRRGLRVCPQRSGQRLPRKQPPRGGLKINSAAFPRPPKFANDRSFGPAQT